MIQGVCRECGRHGWLNDQLHCPKCVRKEGSPIMKARLFKKLIKEVTLVNLKSGDKLFVSFKSRKQFKTEELYQMQKQLKHFFPNNDVLLFSEDINVKVINEE